MTIHPVSRLSWLRRALLVGTLLASWDSATAVERTLKIEAPVAIRAGQEFKVTISAGTDAGKGEKVGFLQAEASIDGGKTWTAICYLQNCGPQVEQPATLKPGPAGSNVMVRARAAFREGLAGDVDYTGAALQWEGSWKEWAEPPAKHRAVAVK